MVGEAEKNLHDAEWTSYSMETPPECITNRTREGDATHRWIDVLGFRPVREERWKASRVVFSDHATFAPMRSPARNELSSD
jgi:hypothetical protein